VSARTVLAVVVAVALGAGCRRGAEPPPRDAAQEAFRDGELTPLESRGKRVFVQRCATCHGPTGRGDGQNAFNLQPPPPDFQESLPQLSVDDRRAVIVGGTAALDRSALCPPWGENLPEDHVAALLVYLEAMAQPTDEDEAPGRRRWQRRP
jgi:mono/diheme cytochrome c family protein